MSDRAYLVFFGFCLGLLFPVLFDKEIVEARFILIPLYVILIGLVIVLAITKDEGKEEPKC